MKPMIALRFIVMVPRLMPSGSLFAAVCLPASVLQIASSAGRSIMSEPPRKKRGRPPGSTEAAKQAKSCADIRTLFRSRVTENTEEDDGDAVITEQPVAAPSPASPPSHDIRAIGTSVQEVSQLARQIADLVVSATVDNISKARDAAVADVAAEAKRLEDLRKAHTELDVLDHNCSAVLRTGNVICSVCTEASDALVDQRQRRSKWIGSNGGYSTTNRLVPRWNEHLDSNMHSTCLEALALREQDAMGGHLSKARERQEMTTRRLFCIRAHQDKEKESFRSYERLLSMMSLLDLDVGDQLHGRHTAKAMTACIADHGRDQLRTFLTTLNEITGHLPHVGASYDKLTDLGGKQSQVHMLRVNNSGTPLTIFASLKVLKLDFDQEHEADGYSCWNKVLEVLGDYGVEALEVLERDEDGFPTKYGDAVLIHGHLKQYRSAAADGEACYAGAGPEKSVRARMVGDHGCGDSTFEQIHDGAHRLDLLLDDTHKLYRYVMDTVHSVVKGVYSHFSRSPHKLRHMKKLVEEWGAEDLYRQLHHLFEVRFVASEYLALKNFLDTLPAIVAALEAELTTGDLSQEGKIQVQGWLRKVKQFKFVAHLIIMVDLHSINKSLVRA